MTSVDTLVLNHMYSGLRGWFREVQTFPVLQR